MKKFKRSFEQSNAAETGPGAAALHIDALPQEMLSHLLSFLTLSEQLKLATVCRRWRQAVDGCLARCRRFFTDVIPGIRHVTDRMLKKILPRLPGLRVFGGIPGRDLDVNVLSRHCPQLVEVDLHVFRVKVSSLKRLCHSCPKLTVVVLPPSCDDACVETVLRGLPDLRSLGLYLSSVTGRCLSLLPPSLQRLEVHQRGAPATWNQHRGEMDLDGVARCPALKELDISGLSRWPSSSCLVKLLNACPRLERLIAKDSPITDDFLERLPEKTPEIRHLDLACCSNLTPAGLKNVGRLKELRSLDLFYTATTNGVLERLKGSFNLTRLCIAPDMFQSPDFSTYALARLVMSCPSLRRVVPSHLEAEQLVERLIGQLSPERYVTVEMDEATLNSFDGLVPEHGPLRLTCYSSYD